MLNLTPHSVNIQLNGEVHSIPSSGVTRVSTQSVEKPSVSIEGLGAVPVVSTVYGAVEGLGTPDQYPNGVLVSLLVLNQLGSEWSGIAFAPATGPKDGAIRDENGQIAAVTKLVTV